MTKKYSYLSTPVKIPKFISKIFYYFTWFLWVWLTVWYIVNDRHWIGQIFGLWPAWFWILGIWLLILLSHQNWKKTVPLVLAWLLFLLFFSEEWKWSFHIFSSPVNQEWESQHNEWYKSTSTDQISSTWNKDIPFRIISYNVNGNLKAIRASAQYQPDICFFQEVPNENLITPDILSLFGKKAMYIDGGDCAILSRVQIKALPELSLKYAGPAVRAELVLPDQSKVLFMNVRLLLPELRLNIFSPDVWESTRLNQESRDEQMEIVMKSIQESLKETDMILGGDFNRPARAGSLDPLRKYFQDTYSKSGIGWGNTMTVDFPVSRIDLIWIPKNWKAIKSRVLNPGFSDHRMLISDIVIINK